MAKRRSALTVGKWLLAAALAAIAYPALQYGAALRDMDRARSLYAQGDLEAALGTYQRVETRLRAHRAMRLIPAGDRQSLLLNQARLLYALNRYDDALEELRKEDDISGIATDGRFYLLRGNIVFRRTMQEFRGPKPEAGKKPSAADPTRLREGLSQAEDSFRQSLERNPNDWDAKHNYELVAGMLKALRADTDNENLKFFFDGGIAPMSELPPDQVG